MTTTSHDPLLRIRHELVAAAGRANRRRRRRQQIVLLVIIPVLLLTVAAGAVAVGGLKTGVAPVDRLLATEGGGLDGIDPVGGPNQSSEPLRLPNSAGGRDAVAVAYVSRDRQICLAQADFRKWDGAPRGSSGGPCYTARYLASVLPRKKAICCGSIHSADHRIYHGVAAGDVVALHFRSDDGATFDARLTAPWTPDLPGAKPLRLFVAVDNRDIDVGGDGLQVDELELLQVGYRVEAELRDGRTVSLRSP